MGVKFIHRGTKDVDLNSGVFQGVSFEDSFRNIIKLKYDMNLLDLESFENETKAWAKEIDTHKRYYQREYLEACAVCGIRPKVILQLTSELIAARKALEGIKTLNKSMDDYGDGTVYLDDINEVFAKLDKELSE